MSTPRACHVVEAEPGQWFAIVALDEGDYDFEEFEIFGPRSTSDAVLAAMNCSNPGGFEEFAHAEATDAHRAMIAKGRRPGRRNFGFYPKF